MLVLGTAQLGNRYGVLGRGVEPGTEAIRLLRMADEAGVLAIDTAPAYGEAEATIGAAAWRGSVHTKVAADEDPLVSLGRSLQRIRRESVDVLYLHDAAAVHKAQPFGRDAGALQTAGAKRLGASIYELAEFDAALRDPTFQVLQVPMSALDRRFAGAPLANAQAHGVAVYVRSVYLQGVLLADPTGLPASIEHLAPYVTQIQSIGRRFDVALDALLLAWVKHQSVSGIIVGVASDQELRALVAAWLHPVPDAAIEALGAISAPDWVQMDPRKWNR